MTGRKLTAFLILVSLFGLIVVAISAVYPTPLPESFAMRKPLIGAAFVLLSVAGMVAVFSPNRCSSWIGFKGKRGTSGRKDEALVGKGRCRFSGHHPDCGNFSAHVIRVGGRIICAGCAGLFIGGLLALAGAFAYFFTGWELGTGGGALVAIGCLAVAIGLLLPVALKITIGSVRLFANAALPLGSFFILVGADSLAQSMFLDAFQIILIFFWLYTKISVSQWGHSRVCRLCQKSDCGARFR